MHRSTVTVDHAGFGARKPKLPVLLRTGLSSLWIHQVHLEVPTGSTRETCISFSLLGRSLPNMSQQMRALTTSAMKAAAQSRFWSGPNNIRIGYYDQTHYSVEGAQHLEKCVDHIKEDLKALNVDKVESK